jgi:hypothetical protein
VAALGVFLAAPPASALEATAFFATGRPSDVWGTGVGGALASTWFEVLRLEGDLTRIPGERPDRSMTSLSGTAALAPPIGKITPYGGVGVGLFRQSDGSRTDTGTLKVLVFGLRFKLKLLVLKAEYRRQSLSGEPLLPMEHRFSGGGGIAF